MQRTQSEHHPRATAPKLRVSMPLSSPVREALVNTPASPTRSLKGALTEIQGARSYADRIARSPSPRSPPPSTTETEYRVPQLPDIDLRPPERQPQSFHGRGQSSSTNFTRPSMPSLDSKLSDFVNTESSDNAETSDFGKESLSKLRPEPLSPRLVSGIARPVPARTQTSRSAMEQLASEQSQELKMLLAKNGSMPSIHNDDQGSSGDTISRPGSNTELFHANGYEKDHDTSRQPGVRPSSEHSLFYPYIGPDDLNALVQKAKSGRNANSEKLKTMLGVYFLTLKEINKSFPSEGESGHGSAEESTGRRTPRSATEASSTFAAFGSSLPPPPPIPQEPTLARSTRSVSSPPSIRNSGIRNSAPLEQLRDSRFKPASKKRTSIGPPPLAMHPEARKLSEGVAPRTPYPRPGDSLRAQRPAQHASNHMQIPESPRPPSVSIPPSRKGSVAVIHNGSLAYIKPNPTQVSSDTVLSLSVYRRHAPSCRRVATLHIPADADQATARKWSTAGLPSTAVAVESSITTSTAPANTGEENGESSEAKAEKKPIPRMSFDDASFFNGLRKQYNKSLMGSTWISRFWRRYIAARCLKRIVVVSLDDTSHACVLPTMLSGNTTGSSAFPGRLSNPFVPSARRKDASGRTASAPTLDAHVLRDRPHGGRLSQPDGTRAAAGTAVTTQYATTNPLSQSQGNPPAGAPRSPRFLARRGLEDTFSEARMLAHFRRPRQGQQRYAWVYWAHRVARDVDEEYTYDADTGVVLVDSRETSGGPQAAARPGGLEFVEGWCCRRIAVVVVLIVVGAVVVCVTWILLGPQSPLSRRIAALPIDGGDGRQQRQQQQQRQQGDGHGDAEARVAAGALLGALWLLVGSLLAALWLAASRLTM